MGVFAVVLQLLEKSIYIEFAITEAFDTSRLSLNETTKIIDISSKNFKFLANSKSIQKKKFGIEL